MSFPIRIVMMYPPGWIARQVDQEAGIGRSCVSTGGRGQVLHEGGKRQVSPSFVRDQWSAFGGKRGRDDGGLSGAERA